MRNLKEYYRPASPEEALAIKREYGDRAAYLAGGTDLMVHRPGHVEVVIDIRHAGIGYVRREGGNFVIGGAALLRDAERGVADLAGGMLTEALRETAPWLIRNAATVSGNIANASPAADSVPALIALDAELVLMDAGTTAVPLQDVLEGPHRTNLGDRLILEIRVPDGERRAGFIKHARSKSDIAQVNVAVAVTVDGDTLHDARIALGAVGPTALRATRAESLLEGERVSGELLAQVEQTVRDEVRPISDWRASEAYRRRIAGILARRALEAALRDEKGGRTS
jgi:carbon-monoxide dehydrogenase medium subunit